MSSEKLIKVLGYSMYPALKPYDYIVIEDVTDFIKNSVYTFTIGKKSVTHRLIQINNNGTLFFRGDRLFSGETINQDDVRGVVKRIFRGKKQIVDIPSIPTINFPYKYILGLYFFFKTKLSKSTGV